MFLKERLKRAFTLIELVVVLIIVATLAGLVLPTLGGLGRTSDMAATASSQREIANATSLYFVLQKRFPQGMDSLLVGDGSVDPTAVFVAAEDNAGTATSDKNLQVSGLPISGAGGANVSSDLTVALLTGNDKRSLTRCGFEFVYDHDYAVTNTNESSSGSAARDLDDFPTVAVVDPASTLFARLLPNGLPPQATQVVAFGFGNRNAAIGKTVNNAPLYPGCDGLYYGRYICYFLLYNTGERATLINVSDAYGRTPDYAIQQFNESLPNGSRQG